MTNQQYILFVDDEAGNRLSFKAYFRRKFAVLVAASAAEAQGLLQSLPIGVVLSDQRMPGMSGLELFAWLRQYNGCIIRVLVSGSMMDEGKDQAVTDGLIHAWVQKPWDTLQLEKQIDHWLGISGEREGGRKRLQQT